MSVQYQGQSMSVCRLAQLTGYPLTSLYRAYHKGLRTGEELLAEATKHLKKRFWFADLQFRQITPLNALWYLFLIKIGYYETLKKPPAKSDRGNL
ncbi:hypothetical protein [Vibrio diabolicus]